MIDINLIRGTGIKGRGNYPDGEPYLWLHPLDRRQTVRVICRITSLKELFELQLLSDILRRNEVLVEEVLIYYLMGQRNDRVFSLEQPHTLKVVSDVINSFNSLNVKIYEPHNLAACKQFIKNCTSLNIANPAQSVCGITILPDEGAASRYSTKWDDIYCTKVRGDEGITITIENPDKIVRDTHFKVVDDLCDGGRTFTVLADQLREYKPTKLTLVVAHAVNLQGLLAVAKVYDEVIITNSYKDWNKEELPINIRVIEVI